MERVHGTSVSIAGQAVLLLGPSGAGKSDLALRLIDRGAKLIADDYSEFRHLGVEILVSAPKAILGQIEVRGIGIVNMKTEQSRPLSLVVQLVEREQVPRLPEPQSWVWSGMETPLVHLCAFDASAVSKVHLALAQNKRDSSV